jgi:hypothetical protein
MQISSVDVVQLSSAQPAIAVHAPQLRSAVALHALVSYIPAVHGAVEHASQVAPFQNRPASHMLQTASVLLVQLTDEHPAIGVQVVHSRFATVEHATASNSPAPQLAAHGLHVVPSAK